jgi:chloride channel protein, CIC family
MRVYLTPRARGWLARVQLSPSWILGALAVAVGLGGAAGVWLFKRLIDLFHQATFGTLTPLGSWAVMLAPVIGGLIVGFLARRFPAGERAHGVAGIMEAVALAGGRLNYRRAPFTVATAALSIGAGASVGPEDPSVQIGANLGSFLGGWLRLSDDRLRALVAAGAAAGIAAAFNAPIAGIFFGLEIILGEFSGNSFSVVVLAAVASAVLTQAVSGKAPAFVVPPYDFSPSQLPLYLVLGLLAGPLSALYIRALYLARDLFAAWQVPIWIKPVAAGLAVGIAGVFLPQIFGVGYDTIEGILNGQPFPVTLLLVLLAVKLVMTPISIGGGFPGGVFAPSLFLGAALGAAFGGLAAPIWPGGVQPAAFAMVGMAAVLAGAVRAPLTAILLLFEMTGNYLIILPLMLAVTVSLILSQHLLHDSVYTLGMARRGLRLERGRDVEVLEGITVGEVMQGDVTGLDASATLDEAAEAFLRTRRHGLPVFDEQRRLVGMLTLQDLERARLPVAEEDDADLAEDAMSRSATLPRNVGEACTRELIVTYPDETLGAALRKMAARDIGRLPVVGRQQPQQLLGLLHRSDVVRAYELALTRRAAARSQVDRARLEAATQAGVVQFVVARGAPCEGCRIGEVEWPRDCVIAGLRRKGRLIIPHGDTTLQAGDVLVAVVEGAARVELQRLCAAQQSSPAAK